MGDHDPVGVVAGLRFLNPFRTGTPIVPRSPCR
jgi:hypothetical protein